MTGRGPSHRRRRHSGRLAVLKLAVSALLLGLLLTQVDLRALARAAGDLTPHSILLALAALAVQAALLAWRWCRIVHGLGGILPYRGALRLIFVGLFFNQLLPSSIGGDVARVWGAARGGLPLGVATSSVLIERLTGVLALALVMLCALPAVWSSLSSPALRLALLMAAPCIGAGLLVLGVGDRMLGGWLPERLVRLLSTLATSWLRIAGNGRLLAEILALGMAAATAGLGAAWAIGLGLGLSLPLEAYLALGGAAVLLTILPVSIAGWGLREVGMVALFAGVGVGTEKALLLSLLYGAALMIASLPGGVLWVSWPPPAPGAEDAASPIARR